MDIYNEWKKYATLDEDIQKELNDIAGDEKAVFERFRCDLTFGTGGLRGIIGAGTNRMNIYTVGRATQGLANSLIKNNRTKKKLSVAIAYDSRNKGELFTKRAASILAANGITVFVYSELAPTPALSFAVRYYGCDAGICVTASHNPAIYNGYKVYGNDGCQIGPAIADSILEEIGNTDIFKDVKTLDYDDAVSKGLIILIGDEVFNAFISEVKKESLFNETVAESEKLNIVYTPLNGAGRRCVTDVLCSNKNYNVSVVKEQEMPDGNFPTCPYPNPENPEALVLALKLCEKTNADLMIATDPDCDRCRIAVKDGKGGYKALSGNQTGILLIDYIAKRKKELGIFPKKPIVVTTIVSTVMADSVAEANGVELRRVLTGFKYIGEQIALLENENREDDYLFGFEESCGYLSGGYVRDKDGVNASMLVAEMALYYKKQGKTLLEVFDELCKKYGYHVEGLLSFSYEGADGAKKMQEIIGKLRIDPPKSFANSAVVKIIDYHKTGLKDGEYNSDTKLPDSDVLEYRTKDGYKVIVRPSGTEPKIKAYLFARGRSEKESEKILDEIKKDVKL